MLFPLPHHQPTQSGSSAAVSPPAQPFNWPSLTVSIDLKDEPRLTTRKVFREDLGLGPDVLSRYISLWTPRYKHVVLQLASMVAPLDESCRWSMAMPAAASQEKGYIYRGIESFANQTIPNDRIEILVGGNYTPRQARSHCSDISLFYREIERAQSDFPNMRIRILPFELTEKRIRNIAFIRALIDDVIIFREVIRGSSTPHYLHHIDADTRGARPECLEYYVGLFDAYSKISAIVGELVWSPEAIANSPNLYVQHVYQQGRAVMNRISRGGCSWRGPNVAYRTVCYALTRGPDANCNMDEEKGPLTRLLELAEEIAGFPRPHMGGPMTRLFTSTRRGRAAVASGQSVSDQWFPGSVAEFGIDNHTIRSDTKESSQVPKQYTDAEKNRTIPLRGVLQKLVAAGVRLFTNQRWKVFIDTFIREEVNSQIWPTGPSWLLDGEKVTRMIQLMLRLDAHIGRDGLVEVDDIERFIKEMERVRACGVTRWQASLAPQRKLPVTPYLRPSASFFLVEPSRLPEPTSAQTAALCQRFNTSRICLFERHGPYAPIVTANDSGCISIISRIEGNQLNWYSLSKRLRPALDGRVSFYDSGTQTLSIRCVGEKWKHYRISTSSEPAEGSLKDKTIELRWKRAKVITSPAYVLKDLATFLPTGFKFQSYIDFSSVRWSNNKRWLTFCCSFEDHPSPRLREKSRCGFFVNDKREMFQVTAVRSTGFSPGGGFALTDPLLNSPRIDAHHSRRVHLFHLGTEVQEMDTRFVGPASEINVVPLGKNFPNLIIVTDSGLKRIYEVPDDPVYWRPVNFIQNAAKREQ